MFAGSLKSSVAVPSAPVAAPAVRRGALSSSNSTSPVTRTPRTGRALTGWTARTRTRIG